MTSMTLPLPITDLNHKWTSTLAKLDFTTAAEELQVWTFYPDYAYGLQGTVVDELFADLFPTIGNRAKKTRREALKSALLTLAQGVSLNHADHIFGFIHARSTSGKATPKRYKACAFSAATFTIVLDALVDRGFVGVHKGFKGKDAAHGLATLWLPQNGFKDWLVKYIADLEIVNPTQGVENMILKNAEKILIDYEDDQSTREMRQRINESNELRAKAAWSYLPLSDDNQFVLDDVRNTLSRESLYCRRIFRDDFESGGRFYCGAQSLRKVERETIEVDGHATIELDFKSLHPRLVYNAEGLEAPDDCYESDQRERNLTKFISLLCLNCESWSQAHRALMSKAMITSEEATAHLQAYRYEHKAIAHRFFASGWRQLQFLDSQLVDAVLAKGVKEGIPVLPIHDSFIVSTEWAFWLKDAVAEAYRGLMGYDAIIDWEPMPDMREYIAS